MILVRLLPFLAAALVTQQATAGSIVLVNGDVGVPETGQFNTTDFASSNSSLFGVVSAKLRVPTDDEPAMDTLDGLEYRLVFSNELEDKSRELLGPPTECCDGRCAPPSTIPWSDTWVMDVPGTADKQNMVRKLITERLEYMENDIHQEIALNVESDGKECPHQLLSPWAQGPPISISCTRRKFVPSAKVIHWTLYSRKPGERWTENSKAASRQTRYDGNHPLGDWSCVQCGKDKPTITCAENKPSAVTSSDLPVTSQEPSPTTDVASASSTAAPSPTASPDSPIPFWRDGINGGPLPQDPIQIGLQNCWMVATVQMFAACARGRKMIRDFFDIIKGAYPPWVGYSHPRWSEQYPQGDPNNRYTFYVWYTDVAGKYEATAGSGWWVGAFMNGVSWAINQKGVLDQGGSSYWIFLIFFLNPDLEENDWRLASLLLPPADHDDKFSHMLKRAGIGEDELFTTIGTSEDIDQQTLDTWLPAGLGFREHAYWITSDPNSNPMDPTVYVHNPHRDGSEQGVKVTIQHLRPVVAHIVQEHDHSPFKEQSSSSSSESSTASPTSAPTTSQIPTSRPDGSECTPPTCFPGLCVPTNGCHPVVGPSGAVLVPVAACLEFPLLCIGAIVFIAGQDYREPKGFDFTYTGPTPTGNDIITLGGGPDSTPKTTSPESAATGAEDGSAAPTPGPTSSALSSTTSKEAPTASATGTSITGTSSQTASILSTASTGVLLSETVTFFVNTTVQSPTGDTSMPTGNTTTAVSETGAAAIPTTAATDSAVPPAITENSSVEPTSNPGGEQPPSASGGHILPPPIVTNGGSGESAGSTSGQPEATFAEGSLRPSVSAMPTGVSAGDEGTASSGIWSPSSVDQTAQETASTGNQTVPSQPGLPMASTSTTASSVPLTIASAVTEFSDPGAEGSAQPTGVDTTGGQLSGSNAPFNEIDGTPGSSIWSALSTVTEPEGSTPSPSDTQQAFPTATTPNNTIGPQSTSEDWAEQARSTTSSVFWPPSSITDDAFISASESSTPVSWDQSAEPTLSKSISSDTPTGVMESKQAANPTTTSADVDTDDTISSGFAEWDSESTSTSVESWLETTTQWSQSTDSFTPFTSAWTSDSPSTASTNSSMSTLPTPPAEALMLNIAARPNVTSSAFTNAPNTTTTSLASTTSVTGIRSIFSGEHGTPTVTRAPVSTDQAKGRCPRRRRRHMVAL